MSKREKAPVKSQGIISGTGCLETHLQKDESIRIQEIANLHQEITDHLRHSLEKAIRIGQLLAEQKHLLEHGEFIPWVKANMPFTDRTARNYMRLFSEQEKLKTESISDLGHAYSFLKRLTWSEPKQASSEDDDRSFITLSVDSIAKDIIMIALDTAKNRLDTDSTARALEHIAYDWMLWSGDLPELLPLETVKGLIERMYGVQLETSNKKDDCNEFEGGDDE